MQTKQIVVTSFQYLFSVFLSALAHPEVICAEGTMIVSKIHIVTGMSSESNYFLAPDDERSVNSYFVKPGIEFGLTTPKSNLIFNYVLDANWYDEKGSQPTSGFSLEELNYVGHDMELSADTMVTKRLTIRIEDNFVVTRDPDQLDYYSNEIIRNKYSKNIFTPQLEYQFSDILNLGAGYIYTNVDYRDDEVDHDSTENRGILNLQYNINKLNSLDLRYQYWDKDYQRTTTPGYTSQQAALFFNRELKYYNWTLSGGYQARKFDNDSLEKINRFIWAVAVATDKPRMNFSLSQNINDTAVDDNYYLATRLNGSVAHTFGEKLELTLQGYYQYSDYKRDPDDREDSTGVISCELTYFRNDLLSIGLELGVEKRDSSLSLHDYENVYILAGIKLDYDLGSKQ